MCEINSCGSDDYEDDSIDKGGLFDEEECA